MSDQWNKVCPACKTDRWVYAEDVIPRLEPGMRVCIDCGCVFAALPKWKRESLLLQLQKRQTLDV